MATIYQAVKGDFDLTEIINGEEVMAPSPFAIHQRIVRRLARSIEIFNEKKSEGEVFLAPLDVIFEESQNRLQPDLIFVRKENLGIVQDWIRGVPDLLVEVVSQGSVVLDTVTKKAIYEKYGVPEYWIVIPELQTIEVFVHGGNQYELFSSNEGSGKVKSKILKGFEVSLKDIFSD